MKREFFFALGGTKLEVYVRRRPPEEWLIKGLVYEWRGEYAPNADDPEEKLMVVYRIFRLAPVLARPDDLVAIDLSHVFEESASTAQERP
jgi:hypothetical protein